MGRPGEDGMAGGGVCIWWGGAEVCGSPSAALEPGCVKNLGGEGAREPPRPSYPLSILGDVQPCLVLDLQESC